MKFRCIPTYHPAAVLRDWSLRAITVHDLKRARKHRDQPYAIPNYQFMVAPSYEDTIRVLYQLYVRSMHRDPLRLAFDLETRAGHIAVAGLAWSRTDAICIPFVSWTGGHYYSHADETNIVWHLYRLLTNRNVQVVGQNLLYDAQYTYRDWHFTPHVTQDTMISQHAVFADQPKSLAHLASMYCDYYVYWKDEGKNINPLSADDARQWWRYNCLDCVHTYEVASALEQVVSQLRLTGPHAAQQAMFWPVLQAMQRGVAVDRERRRQLVQELTAAIKERQQYIEAAVGHPLNVRSTPQMKALFYQDLRQRPVLKRGTGKLTLDDEALQTIGRREPLLRPLVSAIADIRTFALIKTNFVMAELDSDGRMRCSFNIGGSASGTSAPKTYRLSSSTNAFGGGCNLQTIPSDKSKSAGKARSRVGVGGMVNAFNLPNLRSMFVPDPGYTWIDGDLDRADLQVVAWEADDASLKSALRMGADIHLLNAFVLDNREPPPLEELVDGHPRYLDHRGPLKHAREFAKTFCHATNYGAGSRTVAASTGRTVHEIDRAQALWLGAHPGIHEWHTRTERQIRTHKFIENRFGYRWYIFDRIDGLLPEALAWVPQSTVALVINRIWEKLYLMGLDVLLQVHDSLCLQVPTHKLHELIPAITAAANSVVVPYPDPLTIPFGLKVSSVSWGDVHPIGESDAQELQRLAGGV